MRKRGPVLLLRDEVEARLLAAVLEERGIPHFIKSYADSAYAGIQQPHMGWGHLEAPPAFREQIREIYRDITGREPEEPD